MRVGLIARGDMTGLAALTWSFWRHFSPAYTLVLDLSRYGHPAPDMSKYPGAHVWPADLGPGSDFAEVNQPDRYIDQMLDQVDVVFTCETPYNYYLFTEARRRGIKTVLQPMLEFFPYFPTSPTYGWPEPDVLAMPSQWRIQEVYAAMPKRLVQYLPVPVNRDLIPYRPRKHLKNILHTAGTVAQPFRNGTTTLYAAMSLITDIPVRATVYAQRNSIGDPGLPNVDVQIGQVPNYWDFYTSDFDAMVIPRRWGGLCLPMQEALSSGMPVIMPDCSPNNELLPSGMLIPAHSEEQLMARTLLDLYDVTPQGLADRIRSYYEDPTLVVDGSEWAYHWGSEHSWDALHDQYVDVLTP